MRERYDGNGLRSARCPILAGGRLFAGARAVAGPDIVNILTCVRNSWGNQGEAVSIDPQRDTPAVLSEFVPLNQLDEPRWVLANAPEPAVRELAAALGIRFRSDPDLRRETFRDFPRTDGKRQPSPFLLAALVDRLRLRVRLPDPTEAAAIHRRTEVRGLRGRPFRNGHQQAVVAAGVHSIGRRW